MPLNSAQLAELKAQLEAREEYLMGDIARNETEAREDTDRSTPEAMDRMVNVEGEEALLRQADAESTELEDVRAALARMDAGTYGKCIQCGKEIPLARLKAIPWTKYCLEDQKVQGEEFGQQGSLTM